MKEIKFRAWNKRHKKIVYDFILTSIGEIVIRQSTSLGDFSYDKKYWVLMQYTGLKDRQGEEIYEGDILEFDKDEWGSDESNKFEVKWDERQACYIGNGIPTEWKEFCKVIGNIYENKDLLVNRG